MTPPTDRQRAVLLFVADYIRREGRAPSLREISKSIGSNSSNAANDHLARLEIRGLVRRTENATRSIAITPEGYAELGIMPCPTCGRCG